MEGTVEMSQFLQNIPSGEFDISETLSRKTTGEVMSHVQF